MQVYWRGRRWIADGTRLYLSRYHQHNDFDWIQIGDYDLLSGGFIDYGVPITKLKAGRSSLMFTAGRPYVLRGRDWSDFCVQPKGK